MAINNKKNMHKRGLPALTCNSKTLVDPQKLVDSWGRCVFMQKNDFNQQTVCKAAVCWLKNTTPGGWIWSALPGT